MLFESKFKKKKCSRKPGSSKTVRRHRRRRRLGLAVALAGGIFFNAVSQTPVWSATFVVSTLSDNASAPPVGSLREALAAASSGDTIEFNSGLSGTVALDDVLPYIDKNLIIDGNGTGVTISGKAAGVRPFFIGASDSSAVTVEIKDLTISGTAQGGNGGAGGGGGGLGAGGALFVNDGASVTIENVQFANNEAAGGAGGSYLTHGKGGGGGMGGDGGDSVVGSSIAGSGFSGGAAGANGTNNTGSGGGGAGGGGNGGDGGSVTSSGGAAGGGGAGLLPSTGANGGGGTAGSNGGGAGGDGGVDQGGGGGGAFGSGAGGDGGFAAAAAAAPRIAAVTADSVVEVEQPVPILVPRVTEASAVVEVVPSTLPAAADSVRATEARTMQAMVEADLEGLCSSAKAVPWWCATPPLTQELSRQVLPVAADWEAHPQDKQRAPTLMS